MKCVLNSFEIVSYYCIWVSIVIWSLYKLFEAETEIFWKYPYLLHSLDQLSPGWTFLDRKQDISDQEWSYFKYYVQTSWLYLTFQFLVSEVLRQFYKSSTKYWYILSSMFYISFSMGCVKLLIVLIQPMILLTVMLCGGKRISVWIMSIILLISYNFLIDHYLFWQFLADGSTREKAVLISCAMGWTNLRCIIYCLDIIERQEKGIESEETNSHENVLQIAANFFSYVLYLPLLFCGPIVSYGDFENGFQRKSETLGTRLKRFTMDITLFVTYSILLDFASHFFYFMAMHNDTKLMKKLPSTALAGGGLWMSFEFYVKYVIMYGTASSFASLDNMEPPPIPRCIARIHIYSNMWRYFDVALYKFLLKYIYNPCYTTLRHNKILSKHVCKLIASFLPFAFTFLWHRASLDIFIWSVINYVAVIFEYVAQALSTTSFYQHFKSKVLKSEAMEVRFMALLSTPLLVVSVISNFFFFGGVDVGYLYVGLFEWPAVHYLLLTILAGYCCCHVSISLLDVPSRTDRRSRVKFD